MDADRRAALRLAKLRALAPIEDATEASHGFGPVLQQDHGAWAMVDSRRALVGAVVWAARHRVERLDVIADDSDADDIASIATAAGDVRRPAVHVWDATPTGLRPVSATARPLMERPAAPDSFGPLIAVLREHGVDPVAEFDAVVGEIEGLEVARIGLDSEPPLLSVGVGRFDRDLNDMLAEADGSEPAVQLSTAARAVLTHRRPGAPPHPLNRLRRERWLRSMVVRDPELVGCTDLEPVPPLPVDGLRVPSPAPAIQPGTDPVLVVCSAGVDPTLVFDAAELRARHAPDARIVLVVPIADDYALTRELAAAIIGDVEVRPVTAPWEPDR